MRERLSYVYIPGVGDMALMFPSVIPHNPTDPLVEFTIRIPQVAASGARINWPKLCQYGTESAGLYRAYLSATTWMDRVAHKGHPITAEIGAPLLLSDGRPRRRKGGAVVRSTDRRVPNPAARFVRPLSDVDLTRMIGLDQSIRKYRWSARKAFERLSADNVIDLQRDDGGWRIFGASGELVL